MAFFPTSRRNFIRLAAGVGVAAIAADSTLLEPNHPRVVRRDVALRRWPAALEGFTIAVLSDFHYDANFSVHPLNAAVPMVNALRPDLIALTGDFVSIAFSSTGSQTAASAAEPCAQILRQMQSRHGLWAVMGNHDYFTDPDLVTAILGAHKIQVLANQSVAVELNGSRFWLAGVGDVLGQSADLDAALKDIPNGEPTILLAHEPDYADEVARHPVDLQLSGHSHGGQVRIPFLPPLYLPDLAKKYISGFYQIGPLALYTNPGLGTVGVPVRWNRPPEITFLTLRHRA